MIWLDSLYYSIRKDFLSSFQTVLSVKNKIKALLFRVLIYEGLREFIWHDSLSSPGPIAVSKKNQPINELVYVIRMRARRLFLFFNSFSPNMLEMKKLIRDYKINKSLSGLLVYRRIMPLALFKISHLPSQIVYVSLNRGHYPPIYQPPEGVYLLNNPPNTHI